MLKRFSFLSIDSHTMKTFLKITFSILILLIVFLFWAIRKVDYTPYFETGYYEATKNRLDSLASQLSSVEGKPSIGLGKRNITPILNADEDDPKSGSFAAMPLAGYGDRQGISATGIHDSLFVKAIAIQVLDKKLVFVGSDLLIMPPDVSKQVDKIVKDELGFGRESIFYSATHTHSSVGAWSEGVVGELFGGEYNPLAVEWLAKQVSGAIIDAVKDLKPGKMGVANFHAPDYVKNRLVGEDGHVDDDFMIIKVAQDDGKTAIIGSFNAHATTLGGDNLETSGDYPGYFQRKLESVGYDMAVFHAGSVGSHSYRSQGDGFERSRYIGEALADSVYNIATDIPLKDTISINSLTLKIDYPEFQIRVSDGLRLNTYLAGKFFPEIGDVYLQSVKLDSLIWTTTPSDFSGETTLIYKNAMHQKGYRAMVTSFNGAYTGYIIPCKYYHLNEYESRLMNWLGPAYNPYINYLVGEMIEEVSKR